MTNPPNPPSPATRPLRILISRLSAHGDVIQTLPLLDAIKTRYPETFVGWVVEESAAPLLEGHPLLDRLHVSRRKTWLRKAASPNHWPRLVAEAGGLIREIRAARYDLSLDVQGLWKSAVIPALAGIPRRAGYRATREHAAVFYNRLLPPHDLKNPEIPTVLKFMEFLHEVDAALGQPGQPLPQEIRFPLPPLPTSAVEKADALLPGLRPGYPLLAIAPTTIWPSKHWHKAHWRTLFRQLADLSCNVILLGAPAEREFIQGLLESAFGLGGPPPLWRNLAGETGLRELVALMHRVDILIGLDSASLHIANAVGHPRIIGLYGPTGPRRTGPIGAQHRTVSTRLSCQPCFERRCPLETHDCMRDLEPSQVFHTVQSMLQHLNTAPAPGDGIR